MIFHNSSLFFFVFLCFLLFFAAVDGLGWCGDGPDVAEKGWEGLRVTAAGGGNLRLTQVMLALLSLD